MTFKKKCAVFNVSGQKTYPKWTNHFDREYLSFHDPSVLMCYEFVSLGTANSILFTGGQRGVVIMSNIGIASMVWGVAQASAIWGASEVIKYYGIPWLCVSHWCMTLSSCFPFVYYSSWIYGQSS
jgi:omega-6 fatty acid desaturase (delta-12 desaturase)